jgi:murein DD-endopeptidase MepM/ murein hydrolase activator NlpD
MTAAMRRRLVPLGLLAAAAIVSLSAAVAQAQVVKPLPGHAYVDPFTNPGWRPARTDMGIDWLVIRPLPVLAIGNAVILGSNSHDGDWPGGHFIWYRLLDGSHAGDVVYVAEHLKHLVPAGTRVQAGQKIAEALPGGTGTEWGWAEADGATRAHPC